MESARRQTPTVQDSVGFMQARLTGRKRTYFIFHFALALHLSVKQTPAIWLYVTHVMTEYLNLITTGLSPSCLDNVFNIRDEMESFFCDRRMWMAKNGSSFWSVPQPIGPRLTPIALIEIHYTIISVRTLTTLAASVCLRWLVSLVKFYKAFIF